MASITHHIRIMAQDKPLASIDRFEIPSGRVTFLFGESGIGKSILSRAVFGLLDSQTLQIEIDGKPYEDYRRRPSTIERQRHGFFVFQEPSTHLNPLMSIGEQLREGSLAGARGEADILKRLWKTTDASSVEKLMDVYPRPYRPSGGEKQRFLLAMAFKKIEQYLETPSPGALFVFDEPTGSLDNGTRNLFLSFLFDQYRIRPFTILLITHDYSMISEVYTRHPDILEQTVFQELSRAEDVLTLRAFDPKHYLDWLKENRLPAPSPVKIGDTRSSDDVLLRLESGVEAHGRKLWFTNHPDSDSPRPLIIRKRQTVYLKAGSGVGKTTIAKLIMGLTQGRGLDLTIGGRHLTDATPLRIWRSLWGRKIGMVFQHADEALNLNARVRDIFAGLPYPERITPDYEREKLAEYFPAELDDRFLNRPIKYLSGGQKQRLNLARTLSLNTDLVLLDEPLNGLDFMSLKRVVERLKAIRTEGRGLLLISHNEEIFESLPEVEGLYLRAEPQKRRATDMPHEPVQTESR